MINFQQTQAIFKLYSQVVTVGGDTAYDANGDEVAYDLAKVQALVDSQAYIAKRQAEYPPITDYLDGVVKGDQKQIDAYVAACKAVKAKYPKA